VTIEGGWHNGFASKPAPTERCRADQIVVARNLRPTETVSCRSDRGGPRSAAHRNGVVPIR
jgi:hypothetical protein